MRLTTLARKVGMSPGTLRKILDKEGLTCPDDPNVKLDETATRTILDLYGKEEPAESQAIAREEPASEPAPQAVEEEKTDEDEQWLPELSKTDETETSKPGKKEGTVDDIESEDFENIELIKAKKITLEGIKVVGKVELPEPPEKKEESAEKEEKSGETISEEKQKPLHTRKQRERRKSRGRRQKRHRELSYEEKLKREERRKERELKKKLREEKERKRRHYLELVHQQAKAKAEGKAKKKKKQRPVAETGKKKVVQKHPNPIIRFWEWLNGKYDDY